jgi:predicted RNase H-like HicB family nuclease
MPFPGSVLDSLMEGPLGIASMLGTNAGEVNRVMRPAIELPAFRPPVRSVFADREGGAWIELATVSDSSHWVRIAADGTPVGRAALAAGTRLMWASGSTVWQWRRTSSKSPGWCGRPCSERSAHRLAAPGGADGPACDDDHWHTNGRLAVGRSASRKGWQSVDHALIVRRLTKVRLHSIFLIPGFCFQFSRFNAMRHEFTAVYEQDGDWVIAYCPEVPGANGQGRSKAEARTSLADAIALILEERRDDGLRGVPPEAEKETITVEVRDIQAA